MKTPRLLALASALILFMVSPLLHAQTYTDVHDFNNSDGCCASYPSLLAQGEKEETILADYPDLEADDLRACLAYAHAAISHDKLDSLHIPA